MEDRARAALCHCVIRASIETKSVRVHLQCVSMTTSQIPVYTTMVHTRTHTHTHTHRFASIHQEAPEFVDMSIEQEILVTGIKVVDLLAPYAKGGKIGRWSYTGANVMWCVYWSQLVHTLRGLSLCGMPKTCICSRSKYRL